MLTESAIAQTILAFITAATIYFCVIRPLADMIARRIVQRQMKPILDSAISSPTEDAPVRDKDEDRALYLKLATNVCPDCGHKGFYEGPSGGISTNIYCANPACRSGFNVTPLVEIAERISRKGDLSRYPTQEGAK